MRRISSSTVQLDPGAAPELWQGAIGWMGGADGWVPWRLAADLAGRAFAPRLIELSRMGAGVRAAFGSDGETLSIRGRGDDECSPLDVVVDGSLAHRLNVVGRFEHELPLPAGSKAVEVWLPQFGVLQLGSMAVTGVVRPKPEGRRTWIAYGSSITQCRGSAGPSETWPALVARSLDWDLTSLGFAAECHLDPIVAHTIGRMKADVISLCIGVNIYGKGSLSQRTLPGQLSAFIAKIRADHPSALVTVMSPIYSESGDEKPNAVGLTLSEVRRMVEGTVLELAEQDPLLQLISGIEVLTPQDRDVLVDGLHPSDIGYRTMAHRMALKLSALDDGRAGTVGSVCAPGFSS